jgi:predicted anti-sigma-YlaC factor YlaD
MHALGCPDVREVAPDFAFGILDGEARADVLLHLEECPTCQRYVSELSETADAMVLLAPEAEPPPGFERRALDRIVESSRRRRWRTTKLVAVTAAAAVILSVVTVRIVDESRTPTTQSAAPAAGSVPMVGENGTKVGDVHVVTSGTAMAIDVNVAYGLRDGAYGIWLTRSGAPKQEIGTIEVFGGHGTWSDTVPVPFGPAQISIVDDQGNKRCSAALPVV